MKKMSLEQRRKIIQITTICGIIATVIGSYLIYKSPYFKPGGGFGQLLQDLGVFGPVIFVCVQVCQAVYPIIPMGLHNVVGDLVFGTGFGFVLNCIGMLVGSSINFHLGRKYGSEFILAFISDKQFEKYRNKMNEGKAFKNLLRIGFVAPVFPDDIFCMISGLSNMSFREFFKLVVLYRPVSLFVFTFISSQTIQWLFRTFFG